MCDCWEGRREGRAARRPEVEGGGVGRPAHNVAEGLRKAWEAICGNARWR